MVNYPLSVWSISLFVYYFYLVHGSYDQGAHLFLPSYVMRVHGSRQQREAVKRAPKKQLQAVFEVCQYLCISFPLLNKINTIEKVLISCIMRLSSFCC